MIPSFLLTHFPYKTNNVFSNVQVSITHTQKKHSSIIVPFSFQHNSAYSFTLKT